MTRPVYVAVCGAGNPSDVEAAKAAECGRLLAAAGAIVVTGGMSGVMAAASRGAHEAGGTVVGIVPSDRHDDANPHCTVVVPTGMGEARNALVVRTSDAVIAVGGEYGTLSEIALALKGGRVVVGLDTWELRRGGTESTHVRRARMPDEAVRIAITAAKARRDADRRR